MLYNWVKGDVKLFGVRPLSQHYLSLYDEQVRKLRQKVKPGLIPPYYADMPRNIKEINESEKRYITSYLKHPIKTQVTYFLKVVNNILFRGARSG
jgi:lipopolysaccharide/colanic/teichoic acid biosynthesis glycosyltransferase